MSREIENLLSVSATPKAEVLRRLDLEPESLFVRYRRDLPKGRETALIGYGLFSGTCVHVAFDPELEQVVIYEER